MPHWRHAASITELSEVLERIRKIQGIGTTETSIHLQTLAEYCGDQAALQVT
jgi:hypothetical protein